jgi:hypothetical protein
LIGNIPSLTFLKNYLKGRKIMFEKLKFIVSEVWLFLLPFIRVMLTDAGRVLAVVAMNAVTTVASTMGDAAGEEKRAEAFNLITSDLTSKGIMIGTSFINAALEAAVIKLKALE